MLLALTTNSLIFLKMVLYVHILTYLASFSFFDARSCFLRIPICLNLVLQVSLLTDSGNTKDDLRLPTDETLLAQVSASTSALN